VKPNLTKSARTSHIYIKAGANFKLDNGGYLVKGECEKRFQVSSDYTSKQPTFRYEAHSFILPSFKENLALTACNVISFDEPVFYMDDSKENATIEVSLQNHEKDLGHKNRKPQHNTYGNKFEPSSNKNGNSQRFRAGVLNAQVNKENMGEAIELLHKQQRPNNANEFQENIRKLDAVYIQHFKKAVQEMMKHQGIVEKNSVQKYLNAWNLNDHHDQGGHQYNLPPPNFHGSLINDINQKEISELEEPDMGDVN